MNGCIFTSTVMDCKMMKDDDNIVQVKRNTKQVRFNIHVADNVFPTEWINYNVVDFTNRVTSLVNHNHNFEVEIREQ